MPGPSISSQATTASERNTNPYRVLVVVSVGTLLSAMTGSMVNIALPSLGRELEISLEASRWVVQILLIVMGALLLPAGRLADSLGHRRVYLGGFVIFVLASLFCGIAPSFELLLAARAAQAVGGAMILSTSPALLTLSFPPEQRGRALGMQGTATYVGLAVGPALGGLVVASLGWRWTFLVYVPAGLVVLAIGARFLPRVEPAKDSWPDARSTVLLVAGMPLLLAGLSWTRGAAFGWRAALSVAAGFVCIVAFLLRQRSLAEPILDPNLFRSRTFTSAVVAALCNYVALFTGLIMLPFYLEEGLGMDPRQVGLLLSIQPSLMAISASPAGWLSDRSGSRGLSAGGLALVAAGLWWIAQMGRLAGRLQLATALALVGLGVGMFVSPNSSALMGAASRRQQGQAGAMLAESRILGMFLGVALATSVFALEGGHTGSSWNETDFAALASALMAGAVSALLGAAAAWFRK